MPVVKQSNATPNVHWVGTGLSAIPGLRRLIRKGYRVQVYNRTVSRAEAALADLDGDFECHSFDTEKLRRKLAAGDIIVSMLPAEFHVALASLALQQGAHFVCSSYLSPQMSQLQAQAEAAGLCLVNEVGLDPGIDHLMAHALVQSYQSSAQFDPANVHRFTSYCGGLTATPNDFRYKFSWSPVGVLRALQSPSISIKDAREYKVSKVWNAVEALQLAMPWGGETFEVYPNRDSRPFIAEYGMSTDWNIHQFVRGTLRYQGWQAAWQAIFAEIEKAPSSEQLTRMSDQLWQKYALQEGESDRVVLGVSLQVLRQDEIVWHQSFYLDALANQQGSAMARLVSIPVSLAVEAVLQGDIPEGVSTAPRQAGLVQQFLDVVSEQSEQYARVDHLGV